MLIERRGLGGVCLCFFCLLTVTQRLAAQNCVRSIRNHVQTFMSKVPLRLSDCRLYTPSIIDYQKCPRATMKCFAEEVKVLIEEMETVDARRLPKLNMMLDRLANTLNQTNSECPQCELLQVEEAAVFLRILNKTLLMMSNDPRICPPESRGS